MSVSEAVERLREYLDCRKAHDTGDWVHGIGRVELDEAVLRVSDIETLLDSYPPDSDEPIDEEWLRQVGFKPNGLYLSMLLPAVEKAGSVVELTLTPDSESQDWSPSLLQDWDDHVTINSKAFKTRGDVRQLCRALGIELTE